MSKDQNQEQTTQKKTYLVTGAAGFIGARTAQELLNQGHQVVGVDNLNDYYDPSLKQYRLDQLTQHQSFEFIRLDIESDQSVFELFQTHKFDGVINLAARAGVRASLDDPGVYLRTNGQGTLNLLEAMRRSSVQKMVLASTSSLYAGQPMPFTETAPVNTPISPYAATKKAAEVMAYTYHYAHGLDISVVRYFTVYGPAGRPDMMPFRFISWILQGKALQLYGDGSASRDFTYIDDIARGTVAALKPLGYQIINLGGGNNPVSVNAIISLVEGYLGKKAIRKELAAQKIDMDSTWADIQKAKDLLNWEPQISVEEGFRRTAQWHQEQQEFVATLDY